MSHCGLADGFPMGAVMNRSPTLKAGPCHVQRYLAPLLGRIQRGKIDHVLRDHPPDEACGRAAGLRSLREQAGRLHEGGAVGLICV
jgi:hypothetical protein